MAKENPGAILMENELEISDEGLSQISMETGGPSAPSFTTRLVMKIVKRSNGMARRRDGTMNRLLSELMEVKVRESQEGSHDGVYSKDITIDADAEPHVWARFFFPQPPPHPNAHIPFKRKRPVIFHIHGGGFCMLSADSFCYDIFCRRLCRMSESVVVSINYRRAPEHRYPTAYHDSFSVIQWVKEMKNYKERRELMMPYELDLENCILMGDSAGANIVHHVGCRFAREAEEEAAASAEAAAKFAKDPKRILNTKKDSAGKEMAGGGCEWGHWNGGAAPRMKILAHILLFPFFGGEERTEAELRLRDAPLIDLENTAWCWRAFLPEGATRDHHACNVLGPEGARIVSSLTLPPTLVAIGEYDGLKDWQVRYARDMAKLKKPVRLLYYRGGIHAFHLLSHQKMSSLILSNVVTYIKSLHSV